VSGKLQEAVWKLRVGWYIALGLNLIVVLLGVAALVVDPSLSILVRVVACYIVGMTIVVALLWARPWRDH
jgi:flagellar motor component MotA